ncbi:PstA family ABC transporter permease [Terrisporobacter sp.]
MNKKDCLLKLWIYLSGILVISITFGIFIYILHKGFNVMSWQFIFDSPKGSPLGTEGGIFPALIGSLSMGLLSGLIGGIFSILISIYLVFYCDSKKFKKLISYSLYILSGIPSIVLGLVGYTILIYRFGMERGLLCASITLSIMIIPFISIRIIKLLIDGGEEIMNASLCLGVSKSYTLFKIIIPNLMINILTTITLGMAYAMGATAPIMYTGAVIYSGLPNKINSPVMALPYHLYILVNEGLSMSNAYGTAFVLMMLLLIINGLCRLMAIWRQGASWKKLF